MLSQYPGVRYRSAYLFITGAKLARWGLLGLHRFQGWEVGSWGLGLDGQIWIEEPVFWMDGESGWTRIFWMGGFGWGDLDGWGDCI